MLLFVTLALTTALPTVSARAALGRGMESVEADRAHLAAKRAVSAGAAHVVSTLTLPNGEGVVREFARADGVVFAVAWKGPRRPDLRQLLGDRFDSFQAEAVAPRMRRIRGPIGVNRSDLVVRSAGRPGAFFGFAYLPDAVPEEFALSELQ